jgi:DNA-binding beta-propeller fold protein YncE
MGFTVVLVALPALLGAGPQTPPVVGNAAAQTAVPVLSRTVKLEWVRGPADRTGIPGRIDHMAYDPVTKRVFIACVANHTVELIDLEAGKHIGTFSGLAGPQGVAVAGGFVYFTTGDDGRLNRYDAVVPKSAASVKVGADADNVRVASDGKIWVSFGGDGPGGLTRIDGENMRPLITFGLPRMPEGFQLHPTDDAIFANVPAGKRSTADGTVFALRQSSGERLWERRLTGRAGNFPMTLDAANDRVFVVARKPARLISLSARDGSILGEAPCPPESDDLFFDSRSGLVAVIGGGELPTPGNLGGAGASLDLFAIDGSGRPSRTGGSPLPPHSRTGALAADRRNIYVGVPASQDRPAEVREYRLPD